MRLLLTESGFNKIPSDRHLEALRMNDNSLTEQMRNIEIFCLSILFLILIVLFISKYFTFIHYMKNRFLAIAFICVVFTCLVIHEPIFALKRDFIGYQCCKKHVRLPECWREMNDFIHLIPTMSDTRCYYAECPRCNDVWLQKVIIGEWCADFDEEDYPDQNPCPEVLLCECKANHLQTLDIDDFLRMLQIREPQWKGCNMHALYEGYFDFDHYNKYFPLLKNYLYYCAQHPNCRCFWPEITETAGPCCINSCG
jgi:hypothetical protein